MRFRAILDKMIISLNNNNEKNQIRQIEELQIRDTTRFNDDSTITKKDEFSFIVSQNGMFMIDPDIYCEIESFNDNVESGEKNKTTSMKKQEYNIYFWKQVSRNEIYALPMRFQYAVSRHFRQNDSFP